MNSAGSYLRKRHEDKSALGHAGMGYLEVWSTENPIAVQQNVEIEGTWAVGDAMASVAAEAAFEGKETGEQGFGGEAGFEGYGGVEELRLIGIADRGGRVQRRLRDNGAKLVEAQDGGLKRLAGRAGGA